MGVGYSHKVLPIAWTRVDTERWDPVTGRTHACTPDERGGCSLEDGCSP